MEQAIMHGETGKRLVGFNYEYDLSGSYDYSEFDDFTSELMSENNSELQKKLLKSFESLQDNQVHRIINIPQIVGDVVTLLKSDNELIRGYFTN